MSQHLFTCPDCGGSVVPHADAGRTMEFRRGVPPMPVPDDFVVPTCDSCGHTFERPQDEARLTEHLETAFREWQRAHFSNPISASAEAQTASLALTEALDMAAAALAEVERLRGERTDLVRKLDEWQACSDKMRGEALRLRARVAELEAALAKDTPIAYELMRQGGKWLGAARSWVQWHKHNGSEVTWGSNDELRPPFTIGEVERLASEVAEAAIAEYIQRLIGRGFRALLAGAGKGDGEP